MVVVVYVHINTPQIVLIYQVSESHPSLSLSLQDSAELLSFSRTEGSQRSLPVGFRPQSGALSPWLLIHFHGGGFVAQTSKSHEVC